MQMHLNLAAPDLVPVFLLQQFSVFILYANLICNSIFMSLNVQHKMAVWLSKNIFLPKLSAFTLIENLASAFRLSIALITQLKVW